MKPADYAVLILITCLTALGVILIISIIQRPAQSHSWALCKADTGWSTYCRKIEEQADI